MAHPWMTFFLVALAILAIDSMVCTWAQATLETTERWRMTQRRRHSLLEALASTAFGFLVSIAVWPPISVHLLHKPAALSEGLAVIGIYTAISILRGYVVRWVFNRLHAPPRATRCFICGRAATIQMPAGGWCCSYHGRSAP